MPDFLSHISTQMRTAGRQLRILHDYHVTQPLLRCLMSSLQQETTEAVAAVCNKDAWAGAPYIHLKSNVADRKMRVGVELTQELLCACSRSTL